MEAGASGGGASLDGGAVGPTRGLHPGDAKIPEADIQLVAVGKALMALVEEEGKKAAASEMQASTAYTLSQSLAKAVSDLSRKQSF